MDLTPRKKGAPVTLPEGTLARVQASPNRIMQAGIRVEPVLYRLLSRTVRSYGVVEADETRLQDVVARFPGRVEDLAVNTTGEYVEEGQALAHIYSPEFLAGSDEYRRALTAYETMESNAAISDEEKQRAMKLVEGARRRLSLAGFTDEQLNAVGKGAGRKSDVTLFSPAAGTVMEKNVVEGQTVEEGTILYRIADLSTLWIQVLVLESDISAIKIDMPVEVTSVSYPGEIFFGTVDFIYPEVNPENRSVKVRVVVRNDERKLKPGMYANAVVRSPIGDYGPAETMHLAHADLRADAAPAPPADGPLPELPTQSIADAQRYMATLKTGDTYFICTMDPEVVSDKAGDCPLCGMKLVERTKEATSPDASPAVGLPTSTPEDAERFLASVPAGGEYYVCPMDPEVVSNKVEECPKCGMNLERETKPADAEGPDGGSFDRWAEGYACSMHPDELSDKPGVCTICGCGMETVNLHVERVLSVPESAVIDTGTRKVVYVESEPGLYDARAIELGPRSGAYFPVLAGLDLGQKIVSQGAFLIDAEARLNPAAAGVTTTSAPAEGSESEAAGHQHGT